MRSRRSFPLAVAVVGVAACLAPAALDASSRHGTAAPGAARCGNGHVEPGETCDDGNTHDGDYCPSNCRIERCAATTSRLDVSVALTLPADTPVGGVVVLLDYPEGKVSLPGSGREPTVAARVTNLPPGFMSATYDLDYAMRQVIAMNKPLSAGELFRVSFDRCDGAASPAAQEFTCRVQEVSSPGGKNLPVENVACAVKVL